MDTKNTSPVKVVCSQTDMDFKNWEARQADEILNTLLNSDSMEEQCEALRKFGRLLERATLRVVK